jgi:hypothetical protein
MATELSASSITSLEVSFSPVGKLFTPTAVGVRNTTDDLGPPHELLLGFFGDGNSRCAKTE